MTDSRNDTTAEAGLALRYARFVTRFRWPVLLASLAASLLIGSFALRLGLATNYRVFFGPDNPELVTFEALERIYTKNDAVLFVVQARHGDVFTPAHLKTLADLTDEAWRLPYAGRVDSITNFQHTRALGDDLEVADLLPDPERITAIDVARVRDVARGEPLIANRLISDDLRTTGVNVRLQLPGESPTEVPEAAQAARDLRDRLRAEHPELRIELTGFAMLNDAFAEAPMLDAQVVMPAMMLALLLVMFFVLRSVGATALTFALVSLAALVGLGWAGLSGHLLDPASASGPVIILTVAVADAIHIFKGMFAAMRRGLSRRDALVESLSVNTMPVLLTSVTTVIGLLSLNFSDSPPFHLLGNLSAVGVAAAWALSMTFLPAAIAITPLKGHRARDPLAALSARIGAWVVGNSRPLLRYGSVTAAGLLALVATLEINDKPVPYFSERLEIRRASDFTMDALSGIYVSSFSLDSGKSQGVTSPVFLKTVDAFAEFLRGRPGVMHVESFTDTMKRLNRNMHGDDPAEHRLPDSADLASQYLLLYEMSVPYGLDAGDQIDIDKRSLRVNVTYGDVGMEVIRQGVVDARQWLRDNAPASMHEPLASGPILMFSQITRRNLAGMVFGTAFGFSLIALVLALSLRSTRLGILSLLPNILPAGIAFGLWALIQGEVGFAISIVAGLSMGIIVDDTVHFLAKYSHARQVLGQEPREAIGHAFSVVGSALLGTSLIVAIGFGVLALSSFRVTAYMGTLTALTVLAALATDFLLLPALLLAFDRQPARRPRALPAPLPARAEPVTLT